MSAVVGISGVKRNACAAICVSGEIRAVCEQERLTRVRGVGLVAGMPVEAVDEVLGLAQCHRADVTYAVAEEMQLPAPLHVSRVEHHRAHAATAFLTSPFGRAAVLVCDTQPDRELSIWIGDGDELDDQHWTWHGPAFASLYAECAELFEFSGRGNAHRLEALAHLGRGDCAEKFDTAFRYVDGALEVEPRWRVLIDEMIRDEQRVKGFAAETASAIQRRIGQLLLDLLADVRDTVETDAVCLAGGLFYNTYFTTLVRGSGIFRHTFVPINPGNAGLAVGASLMVAPGNGTSRSRPALSPFLGPSYDSEHIKTTLDGCKLSYEFVTDEEAQDVAIAALLQGQLVAWYQDRMEWGHRALGHRSILANPRSEYVLDNLNSFLRKRKRTRPFGLSVSEQVIPQLFCGPSSSPFMEYEYRPRDDRFRHIMPAGATSIRIHSVASDSGMFWRLLQKMEAATGMAALVNTSFNGFREPIVCSPRDAIRVFYGTGLDVLVMGRFILRK